MLIEAAKLLRPSGGRNDYPLARQANNLRGEGGNNGGMRLNWRSRIMVGAVYIRYSP